MKSYSASAIALVALTVGLLCSSSVKASVQFAQTGDSVKLYNSAGASGGIFNVDVLGKTTTGALYNYGSSPYYDFSTFCVEISETISFGQQYEVYDANATKTVNSGKTLGSFAAWLYTQFLKPVLNGGTPFAGITGWGGDLAKDANAIQYGIWRSMGWSDGGGALNGNSGRFGGALGSYDATFLQNLLDAYSKDLSWDADAPGSVAGLNSSWNFVETKDPVTYGNVRIMNLVTYNYDGSIKKNYQDQLVWSPPPPTGNSPVPEPLSVIVWSMLAICVGTISARRER